LFLFAVFVGVVVCVGLVKMGLDATPLPTKTFLAEMFLWTAVRQSEGIGHELLTKIVTL
jgi:hypothetical protein